MSEGEVQSESAGQEENQVKEISRMKKFSQNMASSETLNLPRLNHAFTLGATAEQALQKSHDQKLTNSNSKDSRKDENYYQRQNVPQSQMTVNRSSLSYHNVNNFANVETEKAESPEN